ncbi:MAG: cyclase family protein, partial [Armatimonadota bacterium]|nr:cyclase family protein [Armatimonadota bacterium]
MSWSKLNLLIGIIFGLVFSCGISQVRLGVWRIIDLTHTLQTDIPVWPGNPLFEFRNLAKHAQGYYANAFSCAEHTGTHVDAPIHF